ncbi:hypothetical protein B4U79_18562 [Dinothrombium tinctorium]|uniref:Uncharacterized protein n=1 Tax=Dinothrombium tinctorium TaxID=1965070 RepID=A0A443QEP9_9ACAR|nr:hypothetical protein B4U79_18562 [Dinothrombium tinctorium]
METYELDENYLTNFIIGDQHYPRLSGEFGRLPESIDAAFYDGKNRRGYFFKGSFVYIISKWTKNGHPASDASVSIMQEKIFDCSNQKYVSTLENRVTIATIISIVMITMVTVILLGLSACGFAYLTYETHHVKKVVRRKIIKRRASPKSLETFSKD